MRAFKLSALLPTEDIDDPRLSNLSIHLPHTEEYLACIRPCIHSAGLLSAVVAQSTVWFRERLAKIVQERMPPADRGLTKPGQCIELLLLDFLIPGICIRIVDEPELFCHIVPVVEEDTLTGHTVPPRPSGLLVIGFDVFREIVVQDKPDIRFIDSHAKGNGRTAHLYFIPDKRFLVLPADMIRETSMIRERGISLCLQIRGELFGMFPGKTVDDAGCVPVGFQKRKDLPFRIAGFTDFIGEVFPVERTHEHTGVLQAQFTDDIILHGTGGSRGHRDHRDVRPGLLDHPEFPVLGTEVMTPPGDTVRLVDRNKRKGETLQHPDKPVADEALGRDIEQVDPPVSKSSLHISFFLRGLITRDGRRTYPFLAKVVHLILHERDERRDHHPQGIGVHRKDLVTERFSPAGCLEEQHITPQVQRRYRLSLLREKGGVAPVVPERVVEPHSLSEWLWYVSQ